MASYQDIEPVIDDAITVAVLYGQWLAINNRLYDDETVTEEEVDWKWNDFLTEFEKLKTKYPNLVFDYFEGAVVEHNEDAEYDKEQAEGVINAD